MWTPWETSKECPEFKCTPLFILEGDVTVCIYIRMLRTIASIFGVADWTSPMKLCPWSRVHLVISASTPSRSQCSKLPVRYSFRSRLRLHHQGGSTPFVHEACKAVHQGGGVGCAVAQHIHACQKSFYVRHLAEIVFIFVLWRYVEVCQCYNQLIENVQIMQSLPHS